MDSSTHRLHLPVVDDAFVDDVLDELDLMRDSLPEIGVTISSHQASMALTPGLGGEFELLIALIETALDQELDEPSPNAHAQLAFMSVLPGVPEAVALQIAFGRRVGVQQAQKIALLRSAARKRGLSVDQYVAELSALGRIPRDTLVQLFHGMGRRVPSANRIRLGSSMLRRTASSVPEAFRPPVLSSLAWLQWASGRRPIAAAYLAEALRIQPEHILANGLSQMVGEWLPAWCNVERPD